MKKPYGVIYCPGKIHECPKILAVLGGSLGKGSLFIQCRDVACRRASPNKGWYRIRKNSRGGYTVSETKEGYHFTLSQIPVIFEGAW